MTSLDFAASNHNLGSNGLSSFDFDATPTNSVSNHVFGNSTSTSTAAPSSTISSLADTTTFEDTLYSLISEKEGNKYYKGFRRTHKSQNGQILREQMFWVGDFIQFSIVGNPNEPASIHEGRISSIYTCTLFPNIKKCKVQMLHTQPQVKSEMGVIGSDSLSIKENSARRFMTNLEGEIFLHTITGRVFVVRDAKELKERCGFYVKDDPHVNTIDQDCYTSQLFSNSNNNNNSVKNDHPMSSSLTSHSNTNGTTLLRPQVSIPDSTHLTFSWTMKDFKTPSTSLYNYYTSCVIGENYNHGVVMLSVGNVCTLELRSNSQQGTSCIIAPSSLQTNQTVHMTNGSKMILMGRISKMFEEKSSLQHKYFAIEEIQVNTSNRKTSIMSYTGCVKTVSIHDIISVKKQL
ncbi:hypothetical protein C9374_004598 [Naegleria lovaniensis]|uniref:Uncharacterized protein n=1 Tax=Naegleria lovaniensis TaxID=51637 RepID=A0AA88GQ67_NAELO|nr:uncharacterized protein C9374_004598 [Naegleria lovaniensis]KAG2383261.1 hypothetical protein C9374_004598 [Naegleria lovaniensis]